jgi:hypothetical protein
MCAAAAACTLVGLTVGDAVAAWRSVGFGVDENDTCVVGGVRIRLAGAHDERGRGILGWALAGVGPLPVATAGDHPHRVFLDEEAESAGRLDGLSTVTRDVPDPSETTHGAHPNGVTSIDHVVVLTPDLDRTTAALESLGVAARRTRDVHGGRRQRFFRLGDVILELVGPAEPSGGGPAHFWGLAFTVADIDATAAHLSGRISEPKGAVQAGRRIATLRAGAEVSVPVAFMSAKETSPEAPSSTPSRPDEPDR